VEGANLASLLSNRDQRRLPMTKNPILRACLFLPLVCIGVLAACDNNSNPVSEAEEPDELTMAESPRQLLKLDPLTVMSRNVYLGGDIGPVLGVGFSDLKLLSEVAAGVWGEVQENDFNERAVVLVDEIQEKQPDIVGIQELAQFVVLNFDGAGAYIPDYAGIVDFKGILEAELLTRGLPYSFVAVQENTTVQVPVAGMEIPGMFLPTQLVQLTIRDGVLARNGLKIEGISQGNYAAKVPLGVGPDGNPIELKRGWIRVDVDYKGVPHHFITTHMEVQGFSEIQVLQAQELLGHVAGLSGVTVLLGDFNSDATASKGDLSWTPTHKMITKAGFGDAWERTKWGRRAPGLTCCHLSDLSNNTSTFSQRIDFIFIRTIGLRRPLKRYPGLMALDVIGDEPQDRTVPNQLWPSDHGGLVADFYGSPTWFRRLR
jgi:endonuclease/exonuclease/phosphatase family metal-dependent hydrolase